jgi:acetyl/propionyl-CoA carboxylase alpha subunit
MIAKLIVWAPTRKMAIDKMASLLASTACIGIKTNQFFMRNCLLHPAFQDPAYTTGFIPENLTSLLYPIAHERGTLIQHLSHVIPSLVVRSVSLDGKHGKVSRTSFAGVRQQFRNQRFDKANIHCDIITALNDTQGESSEEITEETLYLCLPLPNVLGDSVNTSYYDLVSLPPRMAASTGKDGKPLSAAAEITARYNGISNILRSKQRKVAKAVKVQLLRCDEITVESQKQSSSSSRDGARAITLELSLDSVNVRAHCVILNSSSPSQTQRVICHFPQLGAQFQYERDSLLSYIDKCRSSVTVAAYSQRTIKAPMPCKVLSVLKKNGDEVKVGETVMVIESMKMEVSINASAAGTFASSKTEGQAVEEGHVLCEIQE